MKRVTGIEVIFQADEKVHVHALSVRLEGKSPVASDANMKLSGPVSVVFTGKGIIMKRLEGPVAEDKILSVALPQANPADFYLQAARSGDCTFAAIARKSTIDNALAGLERDGKNVLQFSLGFIPALQLIPFINESNGAIQTATYSLTVNDGQADKFELAEGNAEYLLAQQYLASRDLLAFAAATNLLADDVRLPLIVFNQKIQGNRDEYKYGSYFKAALTSALGFIFLLLLANFFVDSHYQELNQAMGEVELVNARELSSQQKLNQTLEKQEAFFMSSGWHKASRTSFYADRFASFLPEEMWFSNLSFNPLAARPERDIGFRKDTILLSGKCRDASQISVFVNNIKTMRQVQDVLMKEYSYLKEEACGNFSLQIILKK
ncbi:MAG TPA: hypothetical protein VEB42_04445 [Chitinophagaceae bacterium]|nr:hypothetical protein [Chitinophagaceae bacterium]